MPAVGGPGGKVAAATVVGKLDPALGGDLHDVNILSPGCAGSVLAVPGEGEKLAVGRPGDRCGVTAVGHALDGGAVCIHDVKLGKAGASADPGDLRAGARIEDGGDVGTAKAGDAAGERAVGVGDPDLGVAGARGRVGDVFPVGSPGRGYVRSADTREVDHAVEDEREHANLKAVVTKRGEGKAAAVGRDTRRERDSAEVSEGALVGAVIVHLPDLFIGACD